jgi:hypothetical protein
MASRDDACVEPILDSWRMHREAGSWRWYIRPEPHSGTVTGFNRWAAHHAALLIAALTPLVRIYRGFAGALEIPIRTGESHDAFDRRLLEAIRRAPDTVTSIELSLDLWAYARTLDSPTTPVRGWIHGIGKAYLLLAPPSFGAFDMDCTLFVDTEESDEPNEELHRLNQPLLRRALAAVESTWGPIVEFEGMDGVSETGFDAGSAPRPAPR